MSAIVITALPVAADADTTRGATTKTFGAEFLIGATIVVVVVDVVDAMTARHTSLPDANFLHTSETLWETTLAPALPQTPPGLATFFSPDTTAKPELNKTTPANKPAPTVLRNIPFTSTFHPICECSKTIMRSFVKGKQRNRYLTKSPHNTDAVLNTFVVAAREVCGESLDGPKGLDVLSGTPIKI